MTSRKYYPPEVEQSGAGILAFVSELDDLKMVALRILAKYGVVDPEPSAWYPLQAYLDALREIGELSGPATLKAIGRRIPDKALWPAGVNSVESALKSVDAAYQLNHRGGDVGSYLFIKTGERSGKMICDNPFPCPFDLGILDRVVEKFAPPGAAPCVIRGNPEGCRERGGECCTYVLTW